MAELIEAWLDNPISRRILKFCTKQCSCGRRIELIVKNYTGDTQEMCMGCKAANYIVSSVLDTLIAKSPLSKEEVAQGLKDPVWRKGICTVLEGIARYGIQKPFTANAPFLVVWNITRACNLSCKHCYEDAHVAGHDELTPAQRLIAVDKMADAGIASIAISGGEPLVLPDFFEVAKRIRERDMMFSIATNATLITREKAKQLREAECGFAQVSLDGAIAKTHNSFRGKNAFQTTLRGIKNLVAEDILTGVSMTVTEYNYKEVPAVIDLSEKLGATIFMHYNFIPTGRGKDIVDMDITPQEREDLLARLASQAGKRKINILSTAPQYSRVCIGVSSGAISLTHFDIFGQAGDADAIKFLADFIGGCGTGRLYCAMEPNGDIEPCVFIPIKIGNILEDDII
ncbi:MAG: radical SAM protein, partial [Candidatus Aenigmarchaeota archaeon]|nr:radical SAM protein [Candidatus Aenigmarchaeota archaeon]